MRLACRVLDGPVQGAHLRFQTRQQLVADEHEAAAVVGAAELRRRLAQAFGDLRKCLVETLLRVGALEHAHGELVAAALDRDQRRRRVGLHGVEGGLELGAGVVRMQYDEAGVVGKLTQVEAAVVDRSARDECLGGLSGTREVRRRQTVLLLDDLRVADETLRDPRILEQR